ncbi:MAG: F0F1 ATP synthase subunit A [Opitutales bacterium]|nr:F0F1 ATP synthase subunit A [Opitutales bacterium]
MRPLSLIGLLSPVFVFANSEGVKPSATDLFSLGGVPISNSILTTWIIAILIIVGVRLAVGTPKLIPGKGQGVVEGMAQGLRDALEPIVGKRMIGKTFPLLCGFFVFILLMNWSGLLPGVGTIKFHTAEGWQDAIRPANSDLNTTLALSVLSFVAWTYFVLRYAGIKVLIFDLFGNKADKKEVGMLMWVLLIPIFFAVGGIEVVSIAFRLISLSFRLFGNVFGGENLIHALGDPNTLGVFATYVVPAFAGMLEVLVGVIQAFVFTLLSAVYIGLICNHEGGHDDEHAH